MTPASEDLSRELTRTVADAGNSPSTVGQRLEAVLRASPAGVLGCRAIRDTANTIVDFEYTFANPVAEKICKLSATQIVGRTMRELFPTNFENGLFEGYTEAVNSGEDRHVEHHSSHSRIQGTFDIHASPLDRDELVLTFLDVSLLDESKRKLKRAEAETKLFVEHTPAAVAMLDRDMRYVLCSRQWTTDYELDSDIIGRSHYEVFPDIPHRWKELHQQALEGESLSCEADPFKRDDGSVVWLRWAMHPWHDESGAIGGIIMFTEIITDRINAEQEIREHKNRLDVALDGAELGLWDWTVPTNEMYISDHWFTMLGHDPADFPQVVETWESLVHPEDRAAAWELFEKHASGETTVFNAEQRMLAADGSYRWILTRARIIEWSHDGKPLRMAGIHQDIHERKMQEQAFQENRERLDLALSAAGLGAWDWNIQTTEFFKSSKWLSLLGYKEEDLPEGIDGWAALVHPEDQERVRIDLQRHAMGQAEVFRCEYRLKHANGSYRWVADCGRVFDVDQDGNPARITGVIRDITSEREALERSTELANRLSAAQDASGAGYWTWNMPTESVFYSNRWFQMLGYESGSLPMTFNTFEELVYPEDWPAFSAMLEDHLSGKTKRFRAEIRMRTAEGNWRWIQTVGRVDKRAIDGSPLHMSGFHFDIDRIKDGEEALERARASAEAANRAKSDFLANMSHEIRTPMTAILGYADLLAEASNDPQMTEQADTIRRNGKHLLALINDILDLSKIESGRMTIEQIETEPARVLKDVEELLAERAKAKGIELVTRLETAIPETVATDPTRLRQIVLNLAGNAVKFTESGSVTIQASCPESGAEMMYIDILDTGIGISTEHATQLFQAFNQADETMSRRFGGTGLGLAISRELARLLGGDVVLLESAAGKGSTFRITIATGPIAASKRISAIPESASAQAASSKAADQDKPLDGLRVLLAEDGADNQRLISFHLRKSGAEVDIAENGLLALEALRNNEPYDVVLMDMQMPEMDGYTATSAYRAGGGTKPVIALTAHAMAGDRERCLEAGCDDYATKPINRKELIELCLSWSQAGQDRSAA